MIKTPNSISILWKLNLCFEIFGRGGQWPQMPSPGCAPDARCPVLVWYTTINMKRCFCTKNNRNHSVGLLRSNATRSCLWMFLSSESSVFFQLTASPWTTEASTSERWQFGALTKRKATSSNRDPSLTSLYSSVALSLYRDEWTTIIRLWWISQWLLTHGHHLAVTIYLHVAPSTSGHTIQYSSQIFVVVNIF